MVGEDKHNELFPMILLLMSDQQTKFPPCITAGGEGAAAAAGPSISLLRAVKGALLAAGPLAAGQLSPRDGYTPAPGTARHHHRSHS